MSIKIALAKMAASACIAGVIMVTNLPLLAAHESHAAIVEAKIVDDSVIISPPGGKACDDGKFEISIKTVLAGAAIFYTVDGTMPECGKKGNIYSAPFKNSGAYTIKAVSCHDGKQSAAASESFEVSANHCQLSPKADETHPDSDANRENDKKDVSGNAASSDNLIKDGDGNNQDSGQKNGDSGKSEESTTAGGIQAKLEDAPSDVLVQSGIKDDNKGGPGSSGGTSRQTSENAEDNKNVPDNTKEDTENAEEETADTKSPAKDSEQKLVPLENIYAGDLDSNADNGTEIAAPAVQSSGDTASENLPIAPNGDGTVIEFSLNS